MSIWQGQTPIPTHWNSMKCRVCKRVLHIAYMFSLDLCLSCHEQLTLREASKDVTPKHATKPKR